MDTAVSVAFSSTFLCHGAYEPRLAEAVPNPHGFLAFPSLSAFTELLFFQLFWLETICCYYSHTEPHACWPSVI